MNFETLLNKMAELNGSDIFITEGKPPCVKIHGKINPLSDEPLARSAVNDIVLSLMSQPQREEFTENKELNFAIQVPNIGRFRVSAFYQRSQIAAVLRRIESTIPTLESLSLPESISKLAMVKRGLVIMVGGTGTGKSSTLAAMIGARNRTSSGHIITIEDPIEFIHEHDKSIITQREIGIDTNSFEVALKNTLRQAPDVILIGEIRSKDTMMHAMSFAETGHLCLATLHANNANQALDRIINFFPAEYHQQIWMDLSLNLKAIVAQQLLPLVSGDGRVPAVEILINTPAMAKKIRAGDVSALKTFMAKGKEVGMQTFDQALFQLYHIGKISYEDALMHADSENELRLMVKLAAEGKTPGDTSSLDGVSII